MGGIAAAAAAVAAVGVSSWRSAPTAVPTVAVSYATKVGATDSITLPDSSLVVLAPGSRLLVAANYGQAQRDVELVGAAQFTVRHDPNRPFAVHAGSAVVRDLGTIFAVKSDEGAGVMVAVTEGSVSLSDSAASKQSLAVQLKAGDRGRILANGSVTSERGTVTPEETSWVRGTLVYRDAPLSEVQADLHRWYGVVLKVNDSAMAKLSVSSNASAGEPVAKVLERISASMGGVVTQRGDTAFIDRPGARPRH